MNRRSRNHMKRNKNSSSIYAEGANISGRIKNNSIDAKSFAYGVGASLLAIAFFPQLKDGFKPMIAGAYKGVSNISNHLQETISKVREEIEDIVAEANFENMKESLEKGLLGDIEDEVTNKEG